MTKHLRLVIAFAIAITLHQTAISQSLSVNTDGSTADPSALLDVKSTAKGVLIPRMSKAEKNAIATPATGLLVFQNAPDSIGFHYYDGTAWLWLPAANANAGLGWLTIGNTGTDSALNFLGTLDDKPLMLRQNNLWMGQLNTKMHNYFIGAGSGFNNTAQQNTGFGDSALFNNTTGIGNTAIGYRSMLGSGPITGGVNVGIGRNSLSNISSGSQNVGIGDYAMGNMQTGGVNVIIGPGAMESASKGNSNIGLGLWALRTNDSASNNIAIGQSSLYWNDSARNIGIGYEALAYSNRDNNMAIGFQAGFLNSYLQTTDGSLGLQNTYLGYQSGYYANTGSANVAVGYHALLGQGYFNGNSPGNAFYKRNVAIGDSSMTFAYGSDNVAVGYKTLSKSTNTGRHIAVGSRALMNTVATYPNTAIGYSSQDSATTGWANTSLGSYALQNNKTGGNNTAIGNAAMMEAFNPGGSNYPFDNTAVGNDALRLTRYYGHVAVGAGALRNDTSGTYNTAVGFLAMYNNKRGSWNTAIGTSALRNDTVGWVNTAVGVNAMYNHANGDNNVAMGYNALLNDIDGGANTAIGSHAMVNHKTDGLNTAVGYESMYFDSSGSLNTAMGWRSLRYNKRGSQNTALGVGTIEFTDSAYANTAVGRGAMIGAFNNTTNLAYNTVMGYYAGAFMDSVELATAIGTQAGLYNRGRENTFLGFNSGYGASGSDLTGIENTGLGTATLTYNNTGRTNTAVGMGAMYGNRTGSNNTAVGVRSMLNGQGGNNNVAVGDSTLVFNSGSNSTAVGHFALRDNTTGNFNVAVGTYALENNTIGFRNVAIGDSAMLRNIGGDEMVAIGTESFKSNTGIAIQTVAVGGYTLSADVSIGFNTAVGGYASWSNTTGYANTAIGSASQAANISGTGNTSVGQGTLFNHISGNSNTAIGNSSMQNDTTGFDNTAVGASSLLYNSNGNSNTAIGRSAMISNRTGVGNASLGYQSMYANIGGSWNTAIGSYALLNNIDSDGNTAIGHRALNNNTAGIDNVANGFYALSNTTGSNNTGLGTYAGQNNVTGTNNTALGYFSNFSLTGLTNAAAIGYRALVSQSNSMVLGSINGINGAVATTSVGIGTTAPSARLHVRRNAASGVAAYISPGIIMEDNINTYMEFAHPTANETGILSLNPSGIRSGVVFAANNSLQLRSGGNTNRMILDNLGYIGVNRVPAPGAFTGTFQVQNISSGDDIFGLYSSATGNRWTYWVGSADNNLYMYFNGNSRGNWNNATGVYTATSDQRLKKDITGFNYGLDVVNALTPYKYHYLDNKSTDHLMVGFMAQDVLKIFPEAVYVNTDKNGKEYYSMDYNSFSVLSIKAIQEQQQIINKQQKAIDELLLRVEKLEKKQ